MKKLKNKKKQKQQQEEEDKKKKRRILLAIFIPFGVAAITAGITVPLVISCNKKNNTDDVELGPEVPSGVSIKSANIKLNEDSTIEFNLPSGKTLQSVEATVGDLEVTSENMSINGSILTIKKAAMIEAKVYIKKITLGDPVSKKTANISYGGFDTESITLSGQTTKLTETGGTDTISLPYNCTRDVPGTYAIASGDTVIKTGSLSFKSTGGTQTISITSTEWNKVESMSQNWTITFVKAIGFTNTSSSPSKITLNYLNYEENKVYLETSSDGKNWTIAPSGTESVAIQPDKTLFVRGTGFSQYGKTLFDDENHITLTDATWNLSGSINLLADYTKTADEITYVEEMFYSAFTGSTALINVSDDFLPSKTISGGCYASMFEECTNLKNAPALPAESAPEYAYYYMFYGCKSLVTAPTLNATTVGELCYNCMFMNCESLTTAPTILPAETLAASCYNYMFYGCSALTNAPQLPATTLAANCYQKMFNGCSSLKIVENGTGTDIFTCPAVPVGSTAVTDMFKNCSSSGFTGTPTEGNKYSWYK